MGDLGQKMGQYKLFLKLGKTWLCREKESGVSGKRDGTARQAGYW